MRSESGKIITFYSYKGGTGRSMALSNLSWVLASNGYDVLLIDWDLEAPGLHRYLRYFLIDPELSSTPGLIEFVWEAVRVSMTPAGEKAARPIRFPSLEDYVVGLDWDFPSGGSIAFLPAGRQDANYAQRVNTFDWDAFYKRLGGGKLLQAERDSLRDNYDFILIDSRTGVSDTSSICTVQMPDQLVVLFTLNRQSIRGAAAVAASVRAQRGGSLPIFPVPTRIEDAETDKARLALAYAQKLFEPFLTDQGLAPPYGRAQGQYWSDVKTSYKAYYAFEEVPAAFKDEPGDHGSVLASVERLAARLTDGVVTALAPDDDEKRKLAVVDSYSFAREIGASPPTLLPDVRRTATVRFRRFLRRHIWPHRWQYLVAAIASLIAVISLMALWQVWPFSTQRNKSLALLSAPALHIGGPSHL